MGIHRLLRDSKQLTTGQNKNTLQMHQELFELFEVNGWRVLA
jgi:hypothetical protein